MKAFVFTVALLVGALSVTLAQRETSLRVIDAMRELHPAYRDLRNLVINAVAGAKLNTSDVVFRFHGDVSVTKQSYLQKAIKGETEVLRQVNGQSVAVETSCLGFLRQSVDVNMNLAGVSFTNCLTSVDSSLSAELTRIYAELAINETSYVNLSVYDAFQGRNVFVDPQTIIDRLAEKLSVAQEAPIGLAQELALLVSAFDSRLSTVRAAYDNCLTLNDALLEQTFEIVRTQLQLICQGALLPAASTSEPTATEPEVTEPVETEPTETEPTETEPAETEPAETEPAETETAPTEPAVVETEPTEIEATTEELPEPSTPGLTYIKMQ